MKVVHNSPHHTLAHKQRVRLRADRADVYKNAHAGSEGIVVQHGLDEVGNYPMVYISWDRDNWLVNGEQDMWTFEDHFEPVEKEKVMAEKKISSTEAFKQIGEILAALKAEEEPTPEPKEKETRSGLPLSKNQDEFMEALTKAIDAASESEAFLVISVRSLPEDPSRKILVPDTYVQYNTEEAAYVLQLTVSALSDVFMNDAIGRIISSNKANES